MRNKARALPRLLSEGLAPGDLKDLVLPVVSIDEFMSKIDPQAVVIGFHVQDHDAALDLDRFLQRSAIELLDCDISPASDQNGYYMLFVEVLGGADCAKNIVAIVHEIAPLVDIEAWSMQVRGEPKALPLKEAKLRQLLDSHAAAMRQDDGPSEAGNNPQDMREWIDICGDGL